MHICVYVCVYIYIYICVYTYCMHTCVCVYIYTYKAICIIFPAKYKSGVGTHIATYRYIIRWALFSQTPVLWLLQEIVTRQPSETLYLA